MTSPVELQDKQSPLSFFVNKLSFWAVFQQHKKKMFLHVEDTATLRLNCTYIKTWFCFGIAFELPQNDLQFLKEIDLFIALIILIFRKAVC